MTTTVTVNNNTGQRIYYYIKNSRTIYGYIDDGQEFTSGHKDVNGNVNLNEFRLADNPNARTDWVNALDSLEGDYRVTLQQILDENYINSIEEI